jgi:uncharacterized protein YhhL (DUF1145 family)
MKLSKKLIVIMLWVLVFLSFIYPLFYTEERFIKVLKFLGLLG